MLIAIYKVPPNIKKTCLYNFDPLKPQFYIVKLGFTGVYISFLISGQKQGGSNKYPQSITKTRLYSFDPLKPHFYIAKRGFTGVYNIFLMSAQKQIVGTR